MLFPGVRRRKDQAAVAHNEEGGFQAGDVVIDHKGVAKDKAEIGVGDFDALRPLDPLRGQPDLIQLADVSPGRLFLHLPAAAGLFEFHLPGLDQGGKGVLADDLQEDDWFGGIKIPLIGPFEDDRLHLQLIEIALKLASLARAQQGGIDLEVGFDAAGGKVLLELEDKLLYGLCGKGGARKNRQEERRGRAEEKGASLHPAIIAKTLRSDESPPGFFFRLPSVRCGPHAEP